MLLVIHRLRGCSFFVVLDDWKRDRLMTAQRQSCLERKKEQKRLDMDKRRS